MEGDDYMDMTGRLVNPSFDEGTNGWTLTADGVQVKISTGEKGGVIREDRTIYNYGRVAEALMDVFIKR